MFEPSKTATPLSGLIKHFLEVGLFTSFSSFRLLLGWYLEQNYFPPPLYLLSRRSLFIQTLSNWDISAGKQHWATFMVAPLQSARPPFPVFCRYNSFIDSEKEKVDFSKLFMFTYSQHSIVHKTFTFPPILFKKILQRPCFCSDFFFIARLKLLILRALHAFPINQLFLFQFRTLRLNRSYYGRIEGHKAPADILYLRSLSNGPGFFLATITSSLRCSGAAGIDAAFQQPIWAKQTRNVTDKLFSSAWHWFIPLRPVHLFQTCACFQDWEDMWNTYDQYWKALFYNSMMLISVFKHK